MPLCDRRDDLIAWWEQAGPGHWVYIENPANGVPANTVLAEVVSIKGCLWQAILADGTRQTSALMRRAVRWCEVEVLNRGILS